MKTQKIVTAPILCLLCFQMLACNSFKSDPTRDHKLGSEQRKINPNETVQPNTPLVKEVIVVKEVPKEVVKYVDREVVKNFEASQLFQIQALDSLSFVAGTPSESIFEVRIMQGQVKFEVTAESLPAGSTFKLVKSEAQKSTYSLSVNAAQALLRSKNLEEKKSIKLKLAILELVHEDKDKEKILKDSFAKVEKSKGFELTLRRDRSNPKIEVIGFPERLNQGDKIEFQVKVSAPGTSEELQPELVVRYNSKKAIVGEVLENNGSAFIRASSTRKEIEFVSESSWVFNFELDTTLFSVPPQLNNRLEIQSAVDATSLQAALKVFSPSGATSDEKVLHFSIVKKALPAPVAEKAQ